MSFYYSIYLIGECSLIRSYIICSFSYKNSKKIELGILISRINCWREINFIKIKFQILLQNFENRSIRISCFKRYYTCTSCVICNTHILYHRSSWNFFNLLRFHIFVSPAYLHTERFNWFKFRERSKQYQRNNKKY